MIERYAFGRIAIDGQTFTSDLIVSPERVWEGWWRQQGHRLSTADLDEVFAADPQVLIVGTGMMGRLQVPEATRRDVEERGIDLRVLPTGKAWVLYNELATGNCAVVAALHLTC
jgi:hypothetical protein